jgi:hypothetical protein
VGVFFLHRLIPLSNSSRILLPSPRTGGLQANSGWGEPGGSFASPTGSTLRLRQGERPLEPDSSKNRHPETASVSCFTSYEAKAVSGSALLCDNRITGGALACLESPLPCPHFATTACGQHAAPLRQADLAL